MKMVSLMIGILFWSHETASAASGNYASKISQPSGASGTEAIKQKPWVNTDIGNLTTVMSMLFEA